MPQHVCAVGAIHFQAAAAAGSKPRWASSLSSPRSGTKRWMLAKSLCMISQAASMTLSYSVVSSLDRSSRRLSSCRRRRPASSAVRSSSMRRRASSCACTRPSSSARSASAAKRASQVSRRASSPSKRRLASWASTHSVPAARSPTKKGTTSASAMGRSKVEAKWKWRSGCEKSWGSRRSSVTPEGLWSRGIVPPRCAAQRPATARQRKIGWPASVSSRLTPAECARHSPSRHSASSCSGWASGRASASTRAVTASFSAAGSGGRAGRRRNSSVARTASSGRRPWERPAEGDGDELARDSPDIRVRLSRKREAAPRSTTDRDSRRVRPLATYDVNPEHPGGRQN